MMDMSTMGSGPMDMSAVGCGALEASFRAKPTCRSVCTLYRVHLESMSMACDFESIFDRVPCQLG